jgi:hypothetical protein
MASSSIIRSVNITAKNTVSTLGGRGLRSLIEGVIKQSRGAHRIGKVLVILVFYGSYSGRFARSISD